MDESNRPNNAGRWVFWGFLAIAGFFLIAEHRAHVYQYLPFLLLAACPLMHLFHGHGHHGGHKQSERHDHEGKGEQAESQRKGEP